MLGSTSVVVMGSGIGAVRVSQIVAAAAQALQIAAAANLRIDVCEVPLSEVQDAWTADHGRSRVVLTV